jgi:hypothetical protein
LDPDDDRGVNQTRGFACEYVAWRFITHLSGREAIDFLLYELPPVTFAARAVDDEEAVLPDRGQNGARVQDSSEENEPLMSHDDNESEHVRLLADSTVIDGENRTRTAADQQNDEFASSFENLNALEIAAVSDAKKFLSQRVVQRIIESIWRGDIVFWETLSVNSIKQAKVYNKK